MGSWVIRIFRVLWIAPSDHIISIESFETQELEHFAKYDTGLHNTTKGRPTIEDSEGDGEAVAEPGARGVLAPLRSFEPLQQNFLIRFLF